MLLDSDSDQISVPHPSSGKHFTKRKWSQPEPFPVSPGKKRRRLECVLIPCDSSASGEASTIHHSFTKKHDSPQVLTELRQQPVYERPLIVEGPRTRKQNPERGFISDFFYPAPRTQANKKGSKAECAVPSALKRRDGNDRRGDGHKSWSHSPGVKHVVPKPDEHEAVSHCAASHTSRRPRRSAARQTYYVDPLDDSEMEFEPPKPTHRRPRVARQSPPNDSDFEGHSQGEGEDEGSDHASADGSDSSESDAEDVHLSTTNGFAIMMKNAKVKGAKSSVTKPSASGPRGLSRTGKKTGKATAEGMSKIYKRGKGKPKGLDTSLPPLSDINSIFRDITAQALTMGLREALASFPQPLRVATMCSGTESPLLALEMVQDALQSAGAPELKIDHLFSAEIVPYKQAYIERNFNPPIIFRDISEITEAVNNEVPTATTVYGAKLPIPGNVHILIAGTSCVDFSKLNNSRKSLDQDEGGESSSTWFGVLSYVKAFRPAIVIIENVVSSPWDMMIECYRDIGYEVGGVLLDTKDFYLPHTRRRGYLVCFDKSKAADASSTKAMGAKWQSTMADFRRYASSSVTDFMLPNDKVRTQHHDSLEDLTREYNWEKCELRHIQYRQKHRLGNARPLTFWSESGTMNIPENGIPSWYRKQVERVRDHMDISLLRKATIFDVRHKTRVWDVSQNIDVFEDNTHFGIAPCVTPSGIFFASDAGRALSSEELLGLQGLPLNKISFTTETGPEIQSLAGNAMSTTSVGSAILAAIICGQPVLKGQGSYATNHRATLGNTRTAIIETLTEPVHTPEMNNDIPLAGLMTCAAMSARRCLCESTNGLSQKPIQRCQECGHSTCVSCGGNPAHSYQLCPSPRSSPVEFEQRLRTILPLCLSFNSDFTVSCVSGEGIYADAAREALSSTFRFSHMRRTHLWKAIFRAPSARLELVLGDEQAYWQVFALPYDSLPVNSKIRAILEQPIAIGRCSTTLFDGIEWKTRNHTAESFKLAVEGDGQRITSWLARIELPDYRDQKVWSVLNVKCPKEVHDKVGYNLSGSYQALPQCGTAGDSLYKRLGSEEDHQIYLFLNPSRTGDPKFDSFVFSTEHERLDHADKRPVIASVEPAWTPSATGKVFSSPKITLAGNWSFADNLQLRSVDPQVQISIPLSPNSSNNQGHCREAELVLRCDLSSDNHGVAHKSDGCQDVDAKDVAFFTKYAYALESMRRQLPCSQWRTLDLESLQCVNCAPAKPSLRFVLHDAKTIKPYEDPKSAATYERCIKSRPSPMFFQVTQRDSHTTIDFALNLKSLAHRAIARLPAHDSAIKLTWKLEQGLASNANSKPFTLRSTEGKVAPQDIGMSCVLFPKQASVLQWMQQQEVGSGNAFTIEEAEEAILPALHWRAEVRAHTQVSVRGGICADHPGFGKTITSLALIHSHLTSGQDILADLRERQPQGLIPTKATLIVAPHTLIKQWASEIHEKLGYAKSVLTVSSWRDLNKYFIEDFEKATIILVNRTVLGQAEYAERLANFVAMPGPATNSGRAFSKWLKRACKEVPSHLEILRKQGLKSLQNHVRARYAELIESEEFKATVPSRRLVGRDFVEGKNKSQAVKAAAKSIPTDGLKHPLFEMFYFNRIIVDEFHQYSPREYASLKALKADKRWGLSGTPALSDAYDIAQIAGLLGIRLRIGSDTARVMAQRNIRALRKDVTDFERFDAMREVASDCMHERIHEVAQDFLDAFVRQNIMDGDEMTYDDYLIPVTLDMAHQAAYTELSQQLASQDMNIRKAKSAKTTVRDKRFTAAIEDVQTAEEALTRDAAFLPEGVDLMQMSAARQAEINATLRDLKAACYAAQHDVKIYNESLEQMASTLLDEEALGDHETIRHVQEALRSSVNTKARKPKANGPKRTKRSKLAKMDDESENEGKDNKEEKKARELTSSVNAHAKSLLTSIRSKRYISNVRNVYQAAGQTIKCDGKDCPTTHGQSIAVSALCGHRVCEECYTESKNKHETQCRAGGCGASMHDYHLLWSHTLSASTQTTSHGAKLEAAIRLLNGIKSKGEKAILFVQFAEQLHQVEAALSATTISSTIVFHSTTAGQQISSFRSNADTVIVLNASDETAAGSNLQAANHVIFLSPLLRDSQYGYDSTMAQAIGRVRRHGQQKRISVYRVCALHTIDVDILEHREQRATALTEPEAMDIEAPEAAVALDEDGKVRAERVQLVREGGAFSLRPKSWLYSSGGDGSESEVARAMGRNRVAGWEDFSSQVKFSRAFAGDD